MRRRLARQLALQSLYQLDMNEVTPDEAIDAAIDEAEHDNEGELQIGNDKIVPGYIRELVAGTLGRKAEVDELLQGYLKGWQLDRLSKVDRQILRLAAYEMVYRDDVPPRSAVNEAIELAKHFGSEESGKFVNGVLGKMLPELEQIKRDYGSPQL